MTKRLFKFKQLTIETKVMDFCRPDPVPTEIVVNGKSVQQVMLTSVTLEVTTAVVKTMKSITNYVTFRRTFSRILLSVA